MTESPNVAAFIRARQAQVLERAIATVSTADGADLAAEAHRLAGTLGTFDLADAGAALRTLENAVSDPSATAVTVDEARAAALLLLTTLRKEGT